jgi:hypothetical protein
MISLRLICIVLIIPLSGCLDWMMGGSGEDYHHDVLIKNETSDTILLQIYVDSTEIKFNDPLDYYKLLPDSISYIGSNGSKDFNYDAVQEYLDGYHREAYVIRKKEVIVKQWLKDNDKIGHSPYNKKSWEVNRVVDTDVRAWIKFTIEESDLEE